MVSPYKLFRTDPVKEIQGVIINYGDEAWFKVARAGGSNKRYLKEVGDRLKPFRRQIQTETMDEKVADQIMLEIFVDTVLLGWGSRAEDPSFVAPAADPEAKAPMIDVPYIEGPEGERLDFTRDNALKVLADLPELYAELRTESQRLSTFNQVAREEDAKN